MDNEVGRDASKLQPIDKREVIEERLPRSDAKVGDFRIVNGVIDRKQFGDISVTGKILEHAAADVSS